VTVQTTLTQFLATAPPSSSPFGMPPEASTIAPTIDLVYDIITWISIVFFVGIVAVMGWFMWKYRRTTHVADTGGPTHHTPLEVTWTVIPLILVIAMFYVGFRGYVYVTTPPENAYEVEAVAQTWFWTFNYPNGASEPVLYVPVDEPVRIRMRSEDMLHSLYIPAFRVKQDVVPGKRTQLWFEATDPGIYPLFCAEYCGQGHSQMVTHVEVFDRDEFDVKIEDLANWIKKVPPENLYLAGAYFYNRCANCHTLDGRPLVGPSFQETHALAAEHGKRTLADGTEVVVDENYIRNSILRPLSQIAHNDATGADYPSSMPANIGTQLGDLRREAMVQFILRLDEATEDGRPKLVDRKQIVSETTPGQ